MRKKIGIKIRERERETGGFSRYQRRAIRPFSKYRTVPFAETFVQLVFFNEERHEI